VTALLLALAVLSPGTTVPGSSGPFPGVMFPGALEQESQTVLEREALEFAGAWVGKDTGLLGEAMTAEGIRLHLPGEDHLVIRPHQAQAALRAFLEGYSAGEARVTRVSVTGAGPDKGYAELRWTTGSPGISEPVIFTLFVAYALENESWSLTEIRVLF